MYLLGFVVLGLVLVITAVFVLAAYLIDKGEAELEGGKFDEQLNGSK